MEKTIFKREKAFTLAELLVSFAILGIVSVLTVFSIVSSAKKSKTEAIVSSQNFYNTINSVYSRITATYLDNPYNITKGDSQTLFNSLLNYLDFSSANYDCENVNFNSFEADYCAKLNTKIAMGVKVNNACDTELDVYEYLQKDDKDLDVSEIITRSVDNACGYIIYRTKNSKGIFKQDAFVIPLGKKRFK